MICPDIAGRGLSDPLTKPEDYALPTYIGHMAQLLQQLGLAEVDWVGTSMGGLIGMGLAAMQESPIRRLVLNDVGPFLPKAALERINTYLGHDLRFASLDALEAHLREIHAGFGPLTDAEWRHLAEHSAARREDGRFGLNYDQRLGRPMTTGPIEDVDAVAGLGADPLPGAGDPRHRQRPAAARDRGRDDPARPARRGRSRSTAPAMRRR